MSAPHPWPSAVAALVAGTDRTALPGPPPGWMDTPADAGGDLLARLGWLGAVEAPSAHGTFEAFEEAPGDARCPTPAASARLRTLLPEDGPPSPMLRDWFRLAAGAGVSAPPELIPALLTLPSGTLPDGAVGAWGEWAAWAVDTASGGSADTEPDVPARAPDRVGAYAQWLRDEPDEARQGLLDGFSTKPADVRADIVSAFAARAAPDDEPFLDGCLDDRSEKVKTAAREALASMPGSGLRLRMERMARECVRFSPDTAGTRVSLSMPHPTPDNLRDGVREDGLASLRDILPMVPPSVLGPAPAGLDRALAGKDRAPLLVCALAAACRRFGDAAWAEEVSAAANAARDQVPYEADALADAMADCWAVMPPDRVALQVMRLGGPEGARHPLTALRALARHATRHPLPPGVSRIVVRWAIQQDGRISNDAATAIAMACEPDESTAMLARAAADRAAERGMGHGHSAAIARILATRLAITKDFAP